ncbi:hypothetical protein PROFUN_14457 [Planoprotostelium fungivorum]|uniref:Uncharacterized protein n=1 Tax=Planoprotostelium fungivorum TaxID=1890364 RepID=A0A2P6MX97_9EUKA|nr:hypothetical protein PROFUN_14457 [Planoprotostelium fungivorum]
MTSSQSASREWTIFHVLDVLKVGSIPNRPICVALDGGSGGSNRDGETCTVAAMSKLDSETYIIHFAFKNRDNNAFKRQDRRPGREGETEEKNIPSPLQMDKNRVSVQV